MRRCHGSTSPSLANMHPNSGPKVRSQRQGAKKESKWPSWQKTPEESNHEIATKSMPGADIAQLIGRKEEQFENELIGTKGQMKWNERRKVEGENQRQERTRKTRTTERSRGRSQKRKRLDDTEKGYAYLLAMGMCCHGNVSI